MRVISMVPSWTETLIECGVDVIGRTRYCIHPSNQVKDIPAIGGTKDIDWSKYSDLNADLVVLDREENPKSMADTCPFEYVASHVESVNDVAAELNRLNEKLQNENLAAIGVRWQSVLSTRASLSWGELPGVIDWITPLKSEPKEVVYMIWRKPWMAAGSNTFIGSMFEQLGLKIRLFDQKYPEIQLDEFDKENTLLLFSSEPYPFESKREVIEQLGFSAALVDGECFSWFGLRSLCFLEQIQASR